MVDYSTDNLGMLGEKELLILPGGIELWDRINAFAWSLSSAISLAFALHRLFGASSTAASKEAEEEREARDAVLVVYLVSELIMAQSFAWPQQVARVSYAPLIVGIAGTVNGIAGLLRYWPLPSPA